MTLHYWIDVYPGCGEPGAYKPLPQGMAPATPPPLGTRRFKIAVEIPDEPSLLAKAEELASLGEQP